MLPKPAGDVSTWTRYRCWRNVRRPKLCTTWRGTMRNPVSRRLSWNGRSRWSATSYVTSIRNLGTWTTPGWSCPCCGSHHRGTRCSVRCCRKCRIWAYNRTRETCVLSMTHMCRGRRRTFTMTIPPIRHRRFWTVTKFRVWLVCATRAIPVLWMPYYSVWVIQTFWPGDFTLNFIHLIGN